MAIAKARSAEPVRGYYVTTVFNGRIVQKSGAGFGKARLGGLINAQIEGLTGGGTGTTRFLTPEHDSAPQVAKLHAEVAVLEEKARVADHNKFGEQHKATVEVQAAQAKKAAEVQKEVKEQAKAVADKPKVNTRPDAELDVVKDSGTGETRVTGRDNAKPEDLDNPAKVAAAADKK